MTFFLALPYIVGLYLALRLIWPLNFSAPLKLLLTALLFLICSKQLLAHLLFGGLSDPALPRWAQILWGWLFGAVVIALGLTLLKDLALIVHCCLSRFFGELPKPSPALTTALVTLLSLSLSGWGLGQALAIAQVSKVEIELENLPPQLDGFSLVQLSDIHASTLLTGSWVRELVHRVNALKPDLIVITGDLADGPPQKRAVDLAPLAELAAPHGVFLCPGNHEYIADFQALKNIFTDLGLKLLSNEHIVLESQGAELSLAGLSDPAARRRSLEGPNIEAALAGAPENSVKIVLAHQPALALASAAAGADLQLSGHTHGGHLWPLSLLVAKFNAGFVRGLYEVDGLKLYVSRGTGLWNGFPLRLGTDPEISLLTLRTASKRDERETRP